ncbi:DEAD/DEAH box helicase [Dolichospermum sp. ST_sed1]|nr:DEAD/DEAH box helicase [Dolichospermum sp. ST_sed1]MDD1427229.1 DEAD/DEAH box helicase [Dolichospermum sp. ST_sed9]MDD1432987.1 DEAD/DEAH box helicase [Dolichospermum sp. ST_sed6]MDD1437314.1 DEAD/DEAH box helicase [Dolichospermum sp. ST_sed10]MDD1442582.1 DEAD/DEAH box helicase [Dolichospermum sp. ST_sed3]MDD1448179.1 DEAD/DEAH box helicase [Dolichospermum sp. ST_sed8]MDD1457121.1 DEAD/DEAH box helicase [Dolichospermum sp. ST_sed7]MDD1462347.1 DEAD/DEAH box helicase [Dolichospermum sp. S
MTDTLTPTPGSIVSCRSRQWVVLPDENQDLIRLRPLSGHEEEMVGIYRQLNLENLAPATFPLPTADSIKDHTAAVLLMDAARHLLRSGAGPFRCLGRLSLRPRPYQLVPLLMALRLETVRLLIADDVGIGKTIEAGLIARELLDRGEVRRIAVLCPPHLCEQWQQELREKFHIDAVVVRSGTASKLERAIPNGSHVFSYYRHIIVSLDYAKAERRKASFITHCPDFVIVDEAHTCTRSGSKGTSQQQRHQLIQQIAQKQNRHLLLLSATPHSGIEESFLSLLGLLQPEFENLTLDKLTEPQRDTLASHFIQRRRADVKLWLGNETPFPERKSDEEPYKLSKEYKQLFEEVYNFARGLVKTTTAEMSHAQRRGRYWSALALIRCVMSSPAAAVATLNRNLTSKESGVENYELRITNYELRITNYELDDDLMISYVYDPTDQEQAVDAAPTVVIEQGKQSYGDADKRKLRTFIQAAAELQGNKDQKLQTCINYIQSLLANNYNPIIWCRYIATANYLANALKQKLEKKSGQIRVIAITGEQSEDEREIRLNELKSYPQRVLVATDCLSEGVNLQSHFSAVIHYDLPWNPNRLEQREGRIDRYGQVATQVKICLLYGQDNPVDGAVLEVLIRKAVQIHKTLGITVPVPMDSTTVSEAVFKSLFDKSTDAQQLSLLDLLDEGESAVEQVHKQWDKAVEREKISRTRFAQKAIKPTEVEQELMESDQILGSEEDVFRFVNNACAKLNCALIEKKQGWLLPSIPNFLKPTLGNEKRLITFTTPAPFGVEYVGRNHPLVEGLARHIIEEALVNSPEPLAARCGFTTTDTVTKRTTLLLLRLRHLLTQKVSSRALAQGGDTLKRNHELLGEECAVVGFTGPPSNPMWLTPEEAKALLEQANPVADAPAGLKKQEVEELLNRLDELQTDLELFAKERSLSLSQSHQRVRTITQEGRIQVIPQLPMDLLGVYILQPGVIRNS